MPLSFNASMKNANEEHEDDNDEGGENGHVSQDDNDNDTDREQVIEYHHQQHPYLPTHYGAVPYGVGRFGSLIPPPYGARPYGEVHHHPPYMTLTAAAAAAAQYNEEYAAATAHHVDGGYVSVPTYPEHYSQHSPYALHMMHPAVSHLQHFHASRSPHVENHKMQSTEQNEDDEEEENNVDNDGAEENVEGNTEAKPLSKDRQSTAKSPARDIIVAKQITENKLVGEAQLDTDKYRREGLELLSQSVNISEQIEMRARDNVYEIQKENISNGKHPYQQSIDKPKNDHDEDDEEVTHIVNIEFDETKVDDPIIIAQIELIEKSTPSTELELALFSVLQRKQSHLSRLANEIVKLKQFISKRKQTYKRKRKDDGAPIRPLSAYNIFIQDRFARLAKENELALKSDDEGARLQRVPAHNLVSATGNEWKELSIEEKLMYEKRAQKDKQRYDQQMSQYKAPPDKLGNQKRSKSGYNMFFSAHVLRMKQTEEGVPAERGSVARIVGIAWKELTAEERAYYDREADKYNKSNTWKDGEEDDDDDEVEDATTMAKRHHHHQQQQQLLLQQQQHQQQQHYQIEQYQLHQATAGDSHMHALHLASLQQSQQHDPRHHPYYGHPHHLYSQHAPPPPPYGHFDFSQQHRQQQQQHAAAAAAARVAAQGGYQSAYAISGRSPYEGTT